MKYTCFIDTCSYVNLAHEDCYLNGQTLLDLFHNEVTIKYSHEVNNEIARHYTSLMPDSSKRGSRVYRIKSKKIKTFKEYENRLFNNISERGEKNRGEKHNLITLLDCFMVEQKIGLIYLTDDNNALRGVLNDSIYSFPMCQIWNSYDVILFLYMKCKYFGKDFAETAIRNISSELAKSHTPQTSYKKTEERIKIFRSYIDKLKRIEKVIKK